MADPITIATLAGLGMSGVGELSKFVQAAKQKKLAKKLEQTERPTYKMPSEIAEATSLARSAYASPYLPGQKIQQEMLSGATASNIARAQQMAGSQSALLASATGMGAAEQGSIMQMALEASRQQERDRMALQQQLGVQAGYKEKEFEYNKKKKFEEDAAAAAALREASVRNLYSGLKGFGGLIAGTALNTPDALGGAKMADVQGGGPVGADQSFNMFEQAMRTSQGGQGLGGGVEQGVNVAEQGAKIAEQGGGGFGNIMQSAIIQDAYNQQKAQETVSKTMDEAAPKLMFGSLYKGRVSGPLPSGESLFGIKKKSPSLGIPDVRRSLYTSDKQKEINKAIGLE